MPITGFAEQIRVIGNGKIKLDVFLEKGREYIPTSLILMIVYFYLLDFLNHTRIGKWIYAIGGNPGAARAAGINVDRILIVVYTFVVSWLVLEV